MVWDVASGAIERRSPRIRTKVSDLDVTTDGRTVYTAGQDGRAMIWDLTGDRRLVRPLRSPTGSRRPTATSIRAGSWRAGRRTVALHRQRRAGRTAGRGDHETAAQLPAMAGFAPGIDWSRDGRLIVVTGEASRDALGCAPCARPAS